MKVYINDNFISNILKESRIANLFLTDEIL